MYLSPTASYWVLGAVPLGEGVAENAAGGWSRLRHSLRRDSLKTVHRTVFACVAGRSLRGRLSPSFLQK